PSYFHKCQSFELQILLQEDLELLAKWANQENQGSPEHQTVNARFAVEGSDPRSGQKNQSENQEARKHIEPVKARKLLPAAARPLDNCVTDSNILKQLSEANHNHHHGHQAEAVSIQQSSQNSKTQ